MGPAEDRQRDDLPVDGALRRHQCLLADPLVRACAIVVTDVLGDDPLEVPVVEHEDVIEAFATQRTEKPFTDRVHVRRAHRRADHPDAGGQGERIEGDPELVVVIQEQEPWCPTQGGRVAKLLRHPCDGKRVVAASTTLRVESSMNTSAKTGRKNTS